MSTRKDYEVPGPLVAMRPPHSAHPNPPAHRARSARDDLGLVEKAPIWGAARTGRQALMRQRQGDVTLKGAQGGFAQGPADDVAFGVAAADLPYIETDRQQQLDRLGVGAAVERHEALDPRNADDAKRPAASRSLAAVARIASSRRSTSASRPERTRPSRRDVGEHETFPFGVAFPQC